MRRLTGFPLGPFEKHPDNPILAPQGDSWEAKDVFNPAAVSRDGTIYLLYRAEDRSGEGQWNGTSRIGIAESVDGVHFTRRDTPILEPTEAYELPGGCEDPRVVCVDGTYYLTYTAFDGNSARLCLATSTDLLQWEKHGILFPEWTGGQEKVWSKSGAILPRRVDGRLWMYFGDTNIWAAWSEDGIHWTPVPEPVLRPRAEPDPFDSVLIEPGPQPLWTDRGILLIYNAARWIPDEAASTGRRLRYAAGQALFRSDDPCALIERTPTPFMEPGSKDELTGQVDNVVFLEGLVEGDDADFLYYGMADSKIGVAIHRKESNGL